MQLRPHRHPRHIPSFSSAASMGKKWIPLEANPDVLNEFAKKLGVTTQNFEFTDVYGLDPVSRPSCCSGSQHSKSAPHPVVCHRKRAGISVPWPQKEGGNAPGHTAALCKAARVGPTDGVCAVCRTCWPWFLAPSSPCCCCSPSLRPRRRRAERSRVSTQAFPPVNASQCDTDSLRGGPVQPRSRLGARRPAPPSTT